MRSLKSQLLVALGVGLLVLLVGAGTVVAFALEAEATAEFDGSLLARAQALAALTEEEDGQVEFDYRPVAMPEFEQEAAPAHFQFRHPDGRVLMRSPRLAEDLPFQSFQAPHRRVFQHTMSTGRRVRVVELHYRVGASDDEDDAKEAGEAPRAVADEPLGLILVVARGRERLDALIARLTWILFGAGALALLLGGLLLWWIVRRTTRPLLRLGAHVASLDPERLGVSFEEHQVPLEVVPVVRQLNRLLGRLDEAFERERRFTGNVAHELRTPIAELRSLARVGGRWPDDPEAIRGYFGDVDAVAARMERVVMNLLFLARCQAGLESTRAVQVDIRGALDEVLAPMQADLADRGLACQVEVPPGASLCADADRLTMMLRNLLDNAREYALPGSEIRCIVQSRAGRTRLEISNLAAPMSPEDLERVGDAFWRADPARAAEQHAGLGLSIVRALARLQQLDFGISQDMDGWFRVVLSGFGRPQVNQSHLRTIPGRS